MIERRTQTLSNDLLLQILDHQEKNTHVIAETKALVESLAGDHGRVTALEHAQNRQWWVTVCIGPVLAVAHEVARRMGANV
jgi:hypothetical protein